MIDTFAFGKILLHVHDRKKLRIGIILTWNSPIKIFYFIQIGDDEAEEEDRAIRRVNTSLGMSSIRDSYLKLHTPSVELSRNPLDVGLEMQPAQKPGFWTRFIELMDYSLLKDKYFLNLLFGLSIFYVAEMNFKMVTPFFFANLGYSKADVAYCLSVTAISDIAARVVLPPICDRFEVRKRLIFFVSIVFVGITRSSESNFFKWHYSQFSLVFNS